LARNPLRAIKFRLEFTDFHTLTKSFLAKPTGRGTTVRYSVGMLTKKVIIMVFEKDTFARAKILWSRATGLY